MQAADLGPVPDAEKTQTPSTSSSSSRARTSWRRRSRPARASRPRSPSGRPRSSLFRRHRPGRRARRGPAPLGPRLGVPSVIACRAALGLRGGALVSLHPLRHELRVDRREQRHRGLGVRAPSLAGPRRQIWALGLGLLATAIVAGGPRAVSLADRFAVPLLLLVGGVLTSPSSACPPCSRPRPEGSMSAVARPRRRVGYQVSWLLIFGGLSAVHAFPRRRPPRPSSSVSA